MYNTVNPIGNFIADTIKLAFSGIYSLSNHAKVKAAIQETENYLLIDEAFRENWKQVLPAIQAHLKQDWDSLEQALSNIAATQKDQTQFMMEFFEKLLTRPIFMQNLAQSLEKISKEVIETKEKVDKLYEEFCKEGARAEERHKKVIESIAQNTQNLLNRNIIEKVTNGKHAQLPFSNIRIEKARFTFSEEESKTTVTLEGIEVTFLSKINEPIYDHTNKGR